MIRALVLLTASMLFLINDINAQANLTITIPNVRNSDGSIEIGLFDRAENFPKDDMQYKVVRKKTTSPVFSFTFKDLPLGEYAIALMHDENDDGECNLNFLGIPKEGYGFSNNVRPRLRVPSFDSAKLNLQNDTIIEIRLLYP